VYLRAIRVKNFRLLSQTELDLETQSTLVVGRNNSGKTSLAEVVRRFVEDRPRFQIEDFSNSSYDAFVEALKRHNENADEPAIREILPAIEVRLLIHYEINEPDLGALGEFIVDLDADCNEALAVLHYGLRDGAIADFLEDAPTGELSADERAKFFKRLRERIPKLYQARIWAEDPNDPENRKEVERAHLQAVIRTGFINAQRGLDDITSKENDVLSKVLEELFSTASSDGAREEDKDVANALKEAVQDIQERIEQGFSVQLKGLLPTLETFGYPGLGGPELATETTLDVARLIANATKVRYEGQDGILMPEAYNGLGVRNLIFVLLRIVSFYRAFRAAASRPGIHLVFIEEPEAHLHPQMQEVFIRQLSKIAKKLSEGEADEGAQKWPVQFVVSTHSSHVANASGFESIRYFLPTSADEKSGKRRTVIKDLRQGLKGTPGPQRDFLHQYLTLTRCDLFFADKAILVEGTTERLMLPVVIQKLEDAVADMPKLSSQYLTVMEVGGAYAHLFFDLLDFLELPALIVTDIDSVREPERTACPVHQGTATSNACLNKWFVDNGGAAPTLGNLMAKPDADKVSGIRRVAFQVPETANGPCGRSFEDAFMLANPTLFGIVGEDSHALETSAWTTAQKVKKSEFALKYAIKEQNWSSPRYIVDGLSWLAKSTTEVVPADAPVTTPADAGMAGPGA
jgi:predicted ATP-dependent endonuclease of OLD family